MSLLINPEAKVDAKMFEPFEPNHEKRYQDYLNAICMRRKYPHMFYSALYLLTSPGTFFIGFSDDCVFLLKRRMIHGHWMIYLLAPPISLNGDIDKEVYYMAAFQNKGVSTRLSEEDIKDYSKLTDLPVAERKEAGEYMYSSDEHRQMKGKEFRYMRNYFNNYKKKVDEGIITEHILSKPTRLDMEDMLRCAKEWYSRKKENFSEMACVKGFYRLAHEGSLERRAIVMRDSKGVVQGYTLAESLTDTWSINTNSVCLGKFDGVKQPACANLQREYQYWGEYYDKSVTINRGCGMGKKGLCFFKESQRPFHKLSIFELKTEKKPTPEDVDCLRKQDLQSTNAFGVKFTKR